MERGFLLTAKAEGFHLVKSMSKKKDLVFAQKFKISTPIRYLFDVEVEKGSKKLFEKAWKRAFNRIKDELSETRKKAFDAYFRRLERSKDDTFYTNRLSIKYISRKVGFGVFAKEAIAPYTTIGHYTGVFRPDKEIDPNNDSTFYFGDFPLFSIDALNAGNWVRFMNHSNYGDTKTNVVAWEYYTPRGPYILFTAGPKGIKKGAQLLYSYGDQYWHDKHFTQF